LPSLGITGAAASTLLAVAMLNIIKFLILKAKFNIQPYGKKHLLVIGIAILCIGINLILPDQPQLLIDILLRSMVVSIIFVGLNYLLKTSRQLNDTINNTLNRLRNP